MVSVTTTGLSGAALSGPIPEDELHDIAEESSQSERRADDAERELMEWKKMKFMEQHLGEEFDGLIVSVTKFGMFVELNDMFIEGLVPLGSLTDDHYLYHENTRADHRRSAPARRTRWAIPSAYWSIASTACSTASSSLWSRSVQGEARRARRSIDEAYRRCPPTKNLSS